MCQTRIPSQSPNVGGWANSHGQGMLHLQTSNQSPLADHRGTFVIADPPFLEDAKLSLQPTLRFVVLWSGGSYYTS